MITFLAQLCKIRYCTSIEIKIKLYEDEIKVVLILYCYFKEK